MVRQRPRKGIEELYGTTKLEKTNLTGSNGLQKNLRTEREYAGYLLQSTAPFNTMPSAAAIQSVNVPNAPPILNTNRRKSMSTTRPPHIKNDKLCSNAFVPDDLKKEMIKTNKMIVRQDKPGAYSGANLCDNNKAYPIYGVTNPSTKELHHNMRHQHQHPPHHHQQQHQRMAAGCDDEKEDETDEFFELIKNTVENAVGKTITELLNRNFRDLSAKIDRFSAELKSTNVLLNKLQTDINHKVVHYGEENSRHFRYLCMKSEYDKMFYQHHTANIATPSDGPQFDMKKPVLNRKGNMTEHAGDMKAQHQHQKQQQQKLQQQHQHQHQQGAPCTCRTSREKMQTSELTPSNPPSEDPSISQKSSEGCIREVLEQIKRYCTQFHMSDMPDDNEHIGAKGGNSYRGMDAIETIKVHKKVFEEDDDDETPLSSDGMTPRSSEDTYHGATTMRGNIRTGMGAGDN